MWTTYNTLYQMRISEGRVREAISNARGQDTTNGELINVGLFYSFLEEAVLK